MELDREGGLSVKQMAAMDAADDVGGESAQGVRRAMLAIMHRDLHELCQPLTALRCRLEVGQMLGDPAALREAVEGGLAETRRLFATVASMRSTLREQDEAT